MIPTIEQIKHNYEIEGNSHDEILTTYRDAAVEFISKHVNFDITIAYENTDIPSPIKAAIYDLTKKLFDGQQIIKPDSTLVILLEKYVNRVTANVETTQTTTDASLTEFLSFIRNEAEVSNDDPWPDTKIPMSVLRTEQLGPQLHSLNYLTRPEITALIQSQGAVDPGGQTIDLSAYATIASIEPFAILANSDEIPDAKIPDNITRDIELTQAISGFLNQTEIDTRITTIVPEWAREASPPEVIEQRVVVDVPASNDTIDKIILENGEAYTTVERVIHEATPNQATYDSIRFDLGYFGDESALSATFYRVGRFYYNFTKHTPRVVAYISGNSGPKHWIDGDAGTLVSNIQDDVGYYASDDEATPHVTEVGDVYYNERLRTYRRVKTFTAGTGPVSAPRRQRQANEDDLAALHDQITVNSRNALDLVVVPSPTILDLNNFPESIHVNVRVAINKFDGTSMRINVLGKTVNITSTTTPSYQNDKKIYRIDVPVDSQMQANARAATVGPSAVDYTEVNVSILGGSLGNTELASTIFRMAIFETKDQTARDAAEAAQTDATDALSTARSNESTLDSVRQLPEFPNFGSRDNKVAKFDGDVLKWEEDASGTRTGSLADGSVTTAKLADNAVTSAKLADNAVIARRLAAGAVVTAKIADAAVTDPKIPNNTVKTRHIAADQVTQGEMAADSVGTPELKNDNVTEAKLSSAVRTKLNESGGLSQSQVDARIDTVVDDDFILDLGDNSRTTIDRGKVLGVSSTDENNLVLITPSESGGGVASRVLEDLENRVSDIRIVSPATWDTATGSNVGLNIQQALNRNPENLSYSATGTVPSVNRGTTIYIYIAIPVRQNVSDWRLDLNNFDISYGHSWTRVGAISTTHTIYRFNTTVGGGGAGEQGTNPAATITLQHHGTGSHTAYSGSFEGDAITGIRDEIDGTSISRALSFPTGSRSEVVLRTPTDPLSPAQINISNGEFSKTRRITSTVATEARAATFAGTGNISTAVITLDGAFIDVNASPTLENLVIIKLPDNALIGQNIPMYMQVSRNVQVRLFDESDVEITNSNRLPRNGNLLARYTSESRTLTLRVISGLPVDSSPPALSFTNATAIDGNNKLTSVAMTQNRAFTAAINVKIGDVLVVKLTQDSTGSRTGTWHSSYKWAGGTAPTLSTAGGAIDYVTLLITAVSGTTATEAVGTFLGDVK